MKWIECLFFLATLGFSMSAAAQSQPRSRQDPRFIPDLMQQYVDSQVPTQSSTAAPARRSSSSPQLRRASELLTAASREMSQLADSLNNDIYRAPGVRQVLSLAFQLNADAIVLSRQLTAATEIESLRPALRSLDQDWRSFRYRLGQIRDLSEHSQSHVQRIQQYADQLTSMFQLEPQVDLNALSQNASQMFAALRRLIEDVRYDNRLFSAGRATYEQLQRILALAQPDAGSHSTGYAMLKREFELLQRDWAEYEEKLRTADGRDLQRQIQWINDDMRAMRDALYIDRPRTDRDDLKHTTDVLRGDLDRLLSLVTLKMLTTLPSARRNTIEVASDLDQTCNDFRELLDDELDNIRDMYLYMHDEWRRLYVSLRGIDHQQARQAVQDVEGTLAELQALLGVHFDLDRGAARDLLLQLNGQARRVQNDIREVFSRPNRYAREFQSGCLDRAADFESRTRSLYHSLDRNDKWQTLAEHTRQLASDWNELAALLPQLRSEDRVNATRAIREITPQVVQLQTLLIP